MAKTAAAERVKITRADVVAYMALKVERLELSRRADALKRKEAPLAEKLAAWVRQEMPTGAAVLTKLGHLFQFKSNAGRVDWKAKFIELAGVDEATRLMAEATRSEWLDVQPIS